MSLFSGRQAGLERTITRLAVARERASTTLSAKARAFVLYYEEALDGWQSTLKLYESREPFYRMNDHWADILLAAENYPADTSNRYYWNKKTDAEGKGTSQVDRHYGH